jgi:sRNA-binding protein
MSDSITQLRIDLGVTQLPLIFSGPVVPLALGTAETLAEQLKLPQRKVSLALRRWVSQTAYLQALTEDQAQRYSLDGEPVEPVSAEHQMVAVITLLNRTLRYATQDPAQKAAVRQVAQAVAGKPVLRLAKRGTNGG